MKIHVPADLRELHDQLDAAERDSETLVTGLSEEQGTLRLTRETWSIAECLDHLATSNRVYLGAMQEPANRARRRGRVRKRPARPGWIGQLFVRMLEPPPTWWSRQKAPRHIQPRSAPPLAAALASFVASQALVRDFLRVYADLDLAGIRFPNPFVRGVRFSLATGLHVITAHERRHLWQAWRVRWAMERSGIAVLLAFLTAAPLLAQAVPRSATVQNEGWCRPQLDRPPLLPTTFASADPPVNRPKLP